MNFAFNQDTQRQRQLQMLKLSKQMRSLRNEMEFVEILTQFWPLPNMSQKMERIEQRLKQLDSQYSQYSRLQAG